MIKTYTIGSKVRFVTDGGYEDVKPGAIGIVRGYYGSGYDVQPLSDTADVYPNGLFFLAREVEAITKNHEEFEALSTVCRALDSIRDRVVRKRVLDYAYSRWPA